MDPFEEEEEELSDAGSPEPPTRAGGGSGPGGGSSDPGELDGILADFARNRPPPGMDGRLAERLLQHLKARWLDPPATPEGAYAWVCERIGLEPSERHTPSAVDRCFAERVAGLAMLYQQLEQVYHPDDPPSMQTMVDDASGEGVQRKRDMARIAQVVHHSRRLLLDWSATVALADSTTVLSWEEQARVLIGDDDKLNDHQVVLLHVLDLMSAPDRQFRKYGDSCYREILTPEGERSGAWEADSPILDFIYKHIDKENNYAMWTRLTTHLNTATYVGEHLQRGCERNFPELKFTHRLFSFRNGILDVRAVVFYPFRARALWPALAARAGKRLRVNGDRHEAAPPGDADAAVKYFPYDFEHAGTDLSPEADLFHLEPSEIECPALLKVLESQRLEPDTIYWFFAMLGRMLFQVKELDNWQVFVFLKGVAGSGKSTISQLMRYIYPPEMVGVLSSNTEAKFGLGAFYDKHLVLCPEAKRKFSLPQGDFQSMISGEEVSVAIKYQTAKMVRWTANVLFCGNELPQWTDTSGSMNRRMLMFLFNVKITSVDTGIGELMEQQVGNFLLRAAISYHHAVLRYSKHSIWGKVDGRPILSEQLHDFSTEVMMLVHPLLNYLVQSGEVELTHRNPELELDETFVPEEIFIKCFHNWCRDRGIDKPQWDEDFYRSTFSDFAIARRQDTRVYDGQEQKMTFLFGVRLADRGEEAE